MMRDDLRSVVELLRSGAVAACGADGAGPAPADR